MNIIFFVKQNHIPFVQSRSSRKLFLLVIVFISFRLNSQEITIHIFYLFRLFRTELSIKSYSFCNIDFMSLSIEYFWLNCSMEEVPELIWNSQRCKSNSNIVSFIPDNIKQVAIRYDPSILVIKKRLFCNIYK